MRNLLSFALITCALLNAPQAYAIYVNCTDFYIDITNSTKNECVLTNQEVTQGYLESGVPTSILPNEIWEVHMVQSSAYGPDITLSYQCGSEAITFSSQQNFCFFQAGDISGKVMPPIPASITAEFTTRPGSNIAEMPGIIDWNIINIANH